MKKIFLSLLFISIALFANAYDFMVDGLCYEINSDSTSVTLTYQYYSLPSYSNLSGDIVISENITYNGITYSVTSIGWCAFRGCSGLTSVTIPNSVTEIGDFAFDGCTGFTSIFIPNSVTSIGSNAFEDCTSLTKVDISDIAAWCNIYFYGSYSNPLYYANNLYINGTIVSNLIIPNSVTNIKSHVFIHCYCLTSVTIPNSVTSIGNSAFSGCYGLTSVTIPNSVTSIGSSAFYQCSGLTSITIPNSVTSIGSSAFYQCSGLTSLNIPNSVTSIGERAFQGCTGLTSVTIPYSVTTIGSLAFYGCSGLTSVTWNAKTCNDFSIYNENNPFKDLTSIQYFSFGNEVERIPAYLCYGLSGLNTAIIGENVTSIGENAFGNCSLMENLVALRERPIVIPSNTFKGVPTASCDLHVRQGSKIRYENQDVWKDFLIIVEDAEDWADVSGGGSSSGVYGDVNGDGVVTAADVTAIYNILLENE